MVQGNNRIFIQIASYRDPELLPTLRDCVANAADPSRLTFGLCWQHDETETLAEFADDPRFRVIDVDWRESKGACWARHALQGLYEGEEFTLALDSHHRFEPGWDDKLIAHLAMAPSPNPVLTSYLPSYVPGEATRGSRAPSVLVADPATMQRVLLCRPVVRNDLPAPTRPFPARFFSAHFTFSRGHFLQHCRHDPGLYFHGEEISLAVRAFTHGYDLFHTHDPVIYHYYLRDHRPKHWTDHRFKAGKDFGWNLRDEVSIRRVRRLLGTDAGGSPDDLGLFGLGRARGLQDYQAYAGVDFAAGTVTQAAINGDPIEPSRMTVPTY